MSTSAGGVRRAGPFVRHLGEAIALNKERAPRYAELTDHASKPISDSIIRAERLLLPLAAWFDWRARRYHSAGIPLLGELFVSMDGVPPLSPAAPTPAQRPYSPMAGSISARVRRARQAGGYEGAAAELDAELHALAAAPCFDCMLRHLLRSARRLCTIAPYQLVRVRACGLPPADRLLSRLFELHLAGLSAAARLDARALPIQSAGVPIICGDLPPIPAHPDEPPAS